MAKVLEVFFGFSKHGSSHSCNMSTFKILCSANLGVAQILQMYFVPKDPALDTRDVFAGS